MPKDAYYFRHDANAHTDIKIKVLRQQYGWQGYGWYWYLVEILRSEDGHKLNYNDITFRGLAQDMKCPPEEVKIFIDHCLESKLFNSLNGYFFSERLHRDMSYVDNIKDKARTAGIKSGVARRERNINDRSTTVQRPFNDCSTNLELIKERKGKESILKDKVVRGVSLKNTRIKYGEFNNVLLSDGEYKKLELKFGGELKDKIETLSLAIKSKGYKYKDFYATILAWDRKDKKQTQVKQTRQLPTTAELKKEWK